MFLEVRRPVILLSLVVLAAVLRIYAISLYPLAGDEYGSMTEAKSVGMNWNSIIYSGLMHFWIRVCTSELWLRLPSAIFGTATVAVLFKTGEKLAGWRAGVVAGLLVATSPFNIYHSQEVRFYSLFILASSAFMLATICYVDSRKGVRERIALLVTGVLLVFSHVFGILAIYSQGAAAFLAGPSRWSRRTRMMVALGAPIVIFGLPLIPPVRQKLWEIAPLFYTQWATVDPAFTPISILTLAKVGFTGYIFVFGYHVYPLRTILVVGGASVSLFLLVLGSIRLWKSNPLRMLLLTYPLAILGVYLVIDSVGGRLATGIAPRHVAFGWPVFVLLTAIGAAAFKRPLLYLLVALLLTVNAFSIWLGWKKDWTYGISTDYRSAAAYASRSVTGNTALLHDGRSQDVIHYYFSRQLQQIDVTSSLSGEDMKDLSNFDRLIFVTNDWQPEARRGFDQLLGRLSENYELSGAHVDYPLFEYVLERKSSSGSAGYGLRQETQVLQPVSIYGLEFQDLHLPVSVKVKDAPLTVIGGYGLPDLEERRDVILPLSNPKTSTRLVLLTNVVGSSGLPVGQPIAEVVIEDKSKKPLTFSLRLGSETASWDRQCEPTAPCETVFQWHKRLAIVGQNRYEGALRDFQAGLHGVAFDLPEPREVVKLTIRYTAGSGHLYVWGIALFE